MKEEDNEVGGNNLINRRKFLAINAKALIVIPPLIEATPSNKTSRNTSQGGEGVKRWVMVIDLRKCIGCHTCLAACKSENGVPLGIHYTWVETHEKGTYPNIKLLFLPRLCNHCDAPPCVQVCPVGATYKRADGIVMQDMNKCIGCRYCMTACPYGVRSFLWREPAGAWPEPWRGEATAKKGFVVKCHGCYHRIDKGLKPACVDACVGGARIFGGLEDPNSDVRRIIDSMPVKRLLGHLGFRPMVFYVALDEEAAERGMRDAGAKIVHEG